MDMTPKLLESQFLNFERKVMLLQLPLGATLRFEFGNICEMYFVDCRELIRLKIGTVFITAYLVSRALSHY